MHTPSTPALVSKEPFPVQLVVVEELQAAGEFPGFREGEPTAACIVARNPSERPAELALRAVRRVARIEATNARVERAVMVLDGGRAGLALAARLLVARTILAHMAAHGSGELVLVASGASEPDLRRELREVAALLLSEVAGTPVTVSLRFGGAEMSRAS